MRSCIDAGAAGFVSKASSSAELIAALNHTARGGISLPAGALASQPLPTGLWTAAAAVSQPGANLQPLAQAFPLLTPRQLEVLGALARGLPNKQIARELGISEGTVKQHVNAILHELGVGNRTEAVYLLARLGIGLG